MGTTFWLDLDAEDEPTVWTGDPNRPTAIIRRCQLSGDEATRDEVLRRIVAAGPDPAKVAAEALREAADQLGEYPKWRQFLTLDAGPLADAWWLRDRADGIEAGQ